MIRDINSSLKSIEQETELVYNYLWNCARHQSPEILIQEFRNLFVRGKSSDRHVVKALEKIIFSPLVKQQFDRIFSHCFYLILDCWVGNPESLSEIPELLAILEIINNSSSYDRRRKQLLELIKSYQQSSAFFQLQVLINILQPPKNARVTLQVIATNEISNNEKYNSTLVNSYLPRYTYFYEYVLPHDSELQELNKYLKILAEQRKKDFEIKLSRHIIYRFRLKEVARLKLLSRGKEKVITKVDNPSLLSEKSFRVALKQYIGKTHDDKTLIERTRHFVANNKLRNSYGVFKQDLFRFIAQDIKPRNSNYQFTKRLKIKLANIFPDSDYKPLNNSSILQTCRQLFSFLIIDPDLSTKPQVFPELIANLGTAQVAKILVKLILICPESKPDLEKKIYLIINYYQFSTIEDAPWTIKILEHFLIAFSIYLGKIDVSIAKSARK